MNWMKVSKNDDLPKRLPGILIERGYSFAQICWTNGTTQTAEAVSIAAAKRWAEAKCKELDRCATAVVCDYKGKLLCFVNYAPDGTFLPKEMR